MSASSVGPDPARAGTAAAAFARCGAAVSVGIATGSALAGVLVDERGVRAAFGLGAAIPFVGAVLAWARRATLRAAPARLDEPGEPSTLLTERP